MIPVLASVPRLLALFTQKVEGELVTFYAFAPGSLSRG